MANLTLSKRLKHIFWEPRYPNVGIEFASDSIRMVVVSVEQGRIALQQFDSEEVPTGAVEINPFKPNILKLDVMAEALKSLWFRNRFKSSKVCLLLQDRCALTFHVALEHPAGNRDECLDLIRFKLRKGIPFRMEEAQISYFDASGAVDHSSAALWVTIIHQGVLRQYEQLVQSAIETECGLVDLSTFNLLNLGDWEVRSRGFQDQDLLYVNLNQDYLSVAITQKGKLSFYRSRALEKQNGVIEEALAEIYPATMYYVDKLGGQTLARALVYSAENSEELCSAIQKALQLKAVLLTPESLAGTSFDPSTLRYLRTFAPLVGLVVSRKVEFI